MDTEEAASMRLQVHVISTIAHRDAIFGASSRGRGGVWMRNPLLSSSVEDGGHQDDVAVQVEGDDDGDDGDDSSVDMDDDSVADWVPPFDTRRTLFVWAPSSESGEGGAADPFTSCVIGKRMMRFLVLVAAWEGDHLAESIFAALGTRVVDVLHG
jgi:hypothetical protein